MGRVVMRALFLLCHSNAAEVAMNAWLGDPTLFGQCLQTKAMMVSRVMEIMKRARKLRGITG